MQITIGKASCTEQLTTTERDTSCNLFEIMERSRRRVSPEQVAKKWCQISQDQSGFQKKYINQYIGYGLFATRDFSKGDSYWNIEGYTDLIQLLKTDDVDNTYVFEYRHNGKDML
ncbi:uncharacterized protein LOC115927713 [Strongylocentrotus purpuratus]|uniref:Uncharacterized protein n=1 Tax=Strongylocentrotus purpuratus TaxID=7668 RepID=A0A7M7PCQ9_STRPU|nr:uncharacterized protein LOC115927713 [Strongylocentrotus purpuratus]